MSRCSVAEISGYMPTSSRQSDKLEENSMILSQYMFCLYADNWKIWRWNFIWITFKDPARTAQ